MSDINPVAYGTYRLLDDECFTCVVNAIKLGYRTIDTAILYKNHEQVGKAINFCISGGYIKREELFITSKVHNRDQKTYNTYEACKKIVSELGLDYIDCILLHSYIKNRSVKAYEELIRARDDGIVRYIGVSNFTIPNLEQIKMYEKPYINQIELSVYFQRNELVRYCKEMNITLQAHSCLTNQLKKDIDLPISKMIAWCLYKNINVVVGATCLEYMIENLNVDVKKYTDLDKLDEKNENFCIYKRYL